MEPDNLPAYQQITVERKFPQTQSDLYLKQELLSACDTETMNG